MAKKVLPVKKRPAKKKFVAIAIAATAIASAAGWWTISTGKFKTRVPTDIATHIIDGDTFLTKSDILIRMADMNAPETGRCGSKEATEELTKLISGKPLYLRIDMLDSYKRFIALVYTPEGLVNEAMLRSGWVRIEKRTGPEKEKLGIASQYAIDHKLGIYSEKCLSTKPDKPGCDIIGNVRHGNSDKIYTLPGCQSYPTTVLQKDQGDQWFCTEAEAIKAGFVRSGNCHSNIGKE